MPRSVRVLVVDDSAYIRFTLGALFRSRAGDRGGGRGARRLRGAGIDRSFATRCSDARYPNAQDGWSVNVARDYGAPSFAGDYVEQADNRGAAETVQALTWGAVDFVAKPSARANVAAIADEVVSKVLTAAYARVNVAPLNYQLPSPPRRVAAGGITAVKAASPFARGR